MVSGPRNPLRHLVVLFAATSLTTGLQAQAKPVRKLKRTSTQRLAALWSANTGTSVEAGLRWLAQSQQPGGYWLGGVGHKRGDGYLVFRDRDTQRARKEGHIGITSIAGMAFLSGGHVPHRGKYGEVVAKIVAYVLDHVAESGFISDSGTRMYSHAFATLFLAEVYGMSRNQKIKKGLEKAIHIIVDCQNAHGAWRYNAFSQEADLSVTVCQLQALRAARNIGIQVPRTTIDRAVAYVRQSQTRSGSNAGLFYYKIYGRGNRRKNADFAINAAGITALVSAGVYDRDLIGPAVSFLVSEWRRVKAWYPHHYYFWYGNYYTCQALFHAAGVVRERCFRDYYTAIRDHLLADQRDDGRWVNSVGPGDAFSTAVACIVLQVPKQYLPIFQR